MDLERWIDTVRSSGWSLSPLRLSGVPVGESHGHFPKAERTRRNDRHDHCRSDSGRERLGLSQPIRQNSANCQPRLRYTPRKICSRRSTGISGSASSRFRNPVRRSRGNKLYTALPTVAPANRAIGRGSQPSPCATHHTSTNCRKSTAFFILDARENATISLNGGGMSEQRSEHQPEDAEKRTGIRNTSRTETHTRPEFLIPVP